jgi:hypothetical protein
MDDCRVWVFPGTPCATHAGMVDPPSPKRRVHPQPSVTGHTACVGGATWHGAVTHEFVSNRVCRCVGASVHWCTFAELYAIIRLDLDCDLDPDLLLVSNNIVCRSPTRRHQQTWTLISKIGDATPCNLGAVISLKLQRLAETRGQEAGRAEALLPGHGWLRVSTVGEVSTLGR